MTIFFGKRGVSIQGGHYTRENIIQKNSVNSIPNSISNQNFKFKFPALFQVNKKVNKKVNKGSVNI